MASHTSVVLIFLYLVCIAVNCLSDENFERYLRKGNVNEYRLPNDTIPVHYNIRLNPQISEFNDSFDGEVQIDFKVLEVTSNVVLHSGNLTIDELATSVKKDGSTFKPKEHIYDRSTEKLRLHFVNILQPGIYTLYMKFQGKLSNDHCGFFRSHYEDGNERVPFVVTHFQKTSARRAFPCWDEPALKATFNISLKHFDNYTALSNMPVHMIEHNETDGKHWTHFETTPVMSTNILAFIISDFEHISNSDNTIRVWANRHTISNVAYFMKVVEHATMALSEYLNSTVRVPKMDHVIIPRYSARALENWGLIIYLGDAIPRNTDYENVGNRMINAMTVTHELSHQWFGNLVSPSWWKYFWLSEGMATYLKTFITDQLFKEWRLMDNIIFDQLGSLAVDESNVAIPINEDVTNPKYPGRTSIFVYTKPSVIFWMLSHMIGKEAFRDGLINYIDVHQYSSVTSDDLWEAMQNALNRSDTPHLEFQVKEVMDTWIEQTGYPLVTVVRNYSTGDANVRQQPTIFGRDKTRKEWWIPINYATKSIPDFSITRPTHFLKPGGGNIIIRGIDIDDWIIVNLQQTGYYRVNYDERNWRKIANYLNNDDYKKVHIGNRIQLLDTAFHLLQSREISPDIFLTLANYLRRETDAVVWNYVFSILRRIQKYTRSSTGGEELKSYILGLLSGFLESINYDKISTTIDDVAKRTKIEALTLACMFGDSKCKMMAAARLEAYLQDPETNRVPDVAKYWVFCMGLAQANQSTWNQLFELKIRNRTEQIHETLNYLSCAESSDIIINYLKMSVTENATIVEFTKPIDILLGINTDIVANVDVEIDFIIRNIEIIKAVTNRPEIIFDNLIWKISRQDQLDKLKTFLQTIGINRYSDIHYRERALQKTEKEVAEILRWLRAERASRNSGKI